MRIMNIIKPNPLHITQFTFRKLPGKIEASIWRPGFTGLLDDTRREPSKDLLRKYIFRY